VQARQGRKQTVQSKTGSILIGIAYLALVVFIIIYCGHRAADFNGYSQYWGLFGTLVGVATGAIPSFFFKAQADQANDRAQRANNKAQVFAGALDPQKADELRRGLD
jgi:hypothetical protein